MKARYIGYITLVLGLILAVLAYGVLPQCHADHVMNCNRLIQSAIVTGVLLAGLGVCMAVTDSKAFMQGVLVGVLALGVQLVLTASVIIGACASPMMHCHSTTEPVLIGFGAAMALWALVGMIFGKGH